VSEATAREPRHDLERALVSAIASLPFMNSPGSRQLFVRKLAESIGNGFAVEDHPAARTQIIAIVTECLRHEGGLNWLVVQLKLFAPDDAATIEAAEIVRSFVALDVVPRAERNAAHDLLAQAEGHGLLDVEAMWYAATDELSPLPSANALDLVSAFDQLTRLNARPDGLPPAVAFVEYVASRLFEDLAVQLHRWSDASAAQMGLSTELTVLRREVARSPLPEVTAPCLVIQLEEHRLLAGHYIMTHWTQYRPGPWHPIQGEVRTVQAEDAAAAVDEVVGQAEAIWGSRADRRVHLEFVLPLSLLSEPIEWWPANPGGPGEAPLCLLYPVVVRSLDRLRRPRLHRVWRNRWATMMVARPSMIRHWILEDEANRSRWNYELQVNESISTVVLARPPGTPGAGTADHLWMAIHAGVPVVIWDRRERRGGDFEGTLEALTGGPPERFHARLRAIRAAAASTGHPELTSHSGHHLVIVWDDPTRIVDVSPYPMTPTASYREASGNG